MRTFLAVIGAIFISVLVVVAALGAIVARQGPKMQASAQEYLDETITAYADGWDSEVILARASPEMKEQLKSVPQALEQLERLLVDRLGNLETQEASSCELFMIEQKRDGQRFIAASCLASATGALADVVFEASVIERDNAWSLLGFFIKLDPKIQEQRPRIYQANETVSPAPAASEFSYQSGFPADGLGISIAKDGVRVMTSRNGRVGLGITTAK